jgi:hypothetical protein
MASGNTLVVFGPNDNEPPSSNYATLDTRNLHPILDFDAATDESAVFSAVLPRHYGGGGITITLVWAATIATSGDVVWNTAIERMEAGGTDIDADSFATANAATATTNATSGALTYTTIAHTSGAQMDSLAAGEAFRLKVTRDADNGSDTMTGDAELVAIEIRET